MSSLKDRRSQNIKIHTRDSSSFIFVLSQPILFHSIALCATVAKIKHNCTTAKENVLHLTAHPPNQFALQMK